MLDKRRLYTGNIRNIFNLFIVPSDCWRCRRRARWNGYQAPHTHPRSNATWSNKYGDSRSQEREPVSSLDCWIVLCASLLIKIPSLFLERAVLHLSLHPYRSFQLTYRNHIARRSKSGLYAEVVCRKCGERIADERQPRLDTSTTPVCSLFPQYVH